MRDSAGHIHYLDIAESWKRRLAREWGEKAARHLHFADGFTIAAVHETRSVGLISVYWRDLPLPLAATVEAYIDFLEVALAYRRRGIASHLVDLVIQRAAEHCAYQVRSWSSEDKIEAIRMWQHLGFGLCPASTFPGGREIRGFFVAKVL
jgi:ribosomal protein S18 acetylase RimI-like enzyme